MKHKKLLLTAASSILLLALLAGVIRAYFGANDEVPNLVRIGEDKATVEETFEAPNQAQNFSYRKLVKLKNTGTVPCYVRVAVEFSNSDVQNAASFSSASQDSDTAPDDTTFKSARIALGTDYYINNLPDGWVYVWDQSTVSPDVTHGYYYYENPIDPDEETAALISWVKMNYADMNDIQAHSIYVYSETVQTIDPVTGTAYADWKTAWHSFMDMG